MLPLAALAPNVKNAGANGSTFTVTAALIRPLLVVCICAVPVDTVAGTRKLICVLLTKLTGTAVPLTVTPTPFTSVGNALPSTCQLPVVVDNPFPWIATQVLGAMGPARKLAPFWMPDVVKEGAAWMLASSPCDCSGSLFGPPPIPAVMYRVPGSSPRAPPPKSKDHNPAIAIGCPVLSSSVPSTAPVVVLKALILPSVKFPTRSAPENGPKLAGAIAIPHGELRGPSPTRFAMRLPFKLNVAT